MTPFQLDSRGVWGGGWGGQGLWRQLLHVDGLDKVGKRIFPEFLRMSPLRRFFMNGSSKNIHHFSIILESGLMLP